MLLSPTRMPDLVRHTSGRRGSCTADGIYVRHSCLPIIYDCARIGGPLAGRSPSSRWGVLVSRLSEGCPPTPSASRQFTAASSLLAASPRGMCLYLSSGTSCALKSLAVPRLPHRDVVLVHDRFLNLFDDNTTHPFCTMAAF